MIVVAGENLVDLIVAATGTITPVPGGSPCNTTRTIGRLGVPVAYLGRISEDRFGRGILAALRDDGVDTSLVAMSADPTLLALAELDPEGHASYRFYTAGTAAAGMRPDEAARVLALRPEVLHLGSIALDLEPTASSLEGVLASLGPGTLISLDPNCRPSIIRDLDAYRDRLWRIAGRAALVKASTEDLAILVPGESPGEAARRILAAGPRVVLVTDGPGPVRVVGPHLELTVPVPRVDVVDTVGAGDAFAGGFLARWVERGLGRDALADPEALRDAARFAVAVAALTCRRAGAQPPRRAELEASGLLTG